MNQEEISKANKLYDAGLVYELYEFIEPFLEKDDPYAFYFSSRFSLSDWDESDEEFDKRSLDLLTKAADEGVVEAMYRLSSFYFTGDIVEMNLETGKRYLDSAARLNYGPAKLSLGINLYYGSNGYSKDIEKAVEFISDAVNENVEGASEVLEKIKTHNKIRDTHL